jgi:hypothetical protein
LVALLLLYQRSWLSIPLDPPPRLLVALVHGVPPICASFAWHLFLLRVAHRRHHDHTQEQDTGQEEDITGQDPDVPAGEPDQPATAPPAAKTGAAGNGQDGEPSRVLVQVLLAGETQDRPVSWQDVATQTGLCRSRAYALLREERTRLAVTNGQRSAGSPTDPAP